MPSAYHQAPISTWRGWLGLALASTLLAACVGVTPPLPPQAGPAKALPPLEPEVQGPERSAPSPAQRPASPAPSTAPSPRAQPSPSPSLSPPPAPVAPPPAGGGGGGGGGSPTTVAPQASPSPTSTLPAGIQVGPLGSLPSFRTPSGGASLPLTLSPLLPKAREASGQALPLQIQPGLPLPAPSSPSSDLRLEGNGELPVQKVDQGPLWHLIWGAALPGAMEDPGGSATIGGIWALPTRRP